MEIEISHSVFKEKKLAVETAGWIRGPKLLVNGEVIKKVKGRYIVKNDDGAETTIQLKYNFLDPIPKIKIGENTLELASSLKWYEYVWIGIPILLVFAGGAIGGFFGGAAAVTNGRLFRSDRSLLSKYGFSLLTTIGAVILYIIFAIAFQIIVGAEK
jgi:hypothetical protein